MFDQFAADVNMERLIIDSTIIRAHPHAAGAAHKRGQNAQALGNPLRFTLTSGARYDITQAAELIDGLESEYVIADAGMTWISFSSMS